MQRALRNQAITNQRILDAEQERNDEYDEHATEFQPDDAAASNDATAGVGTHSGMSNGPIGKPIA